LTDTISVHFAHITDIHISDRGDSWGALGGQAARLLAACFERLNAIADLDFVLITGDVLDMATPEEIAALTEALSTLEKPWHFVPGNHDGFLDPQHPDAYKPHEAIPLIDPRLAEPKPEAQKAHWSRTVKPGIRLIGLDSRKADHWSGVIDDAQLKWLKGELDAHQNDLIILAVHHPLHKLSPYNDRPWWSNFICGNGPQVERLLDAYPNVRLVLAGHHHANQIRARDARLHVNTAALSGYPCVYRTVRASAKGNGWHVQIKTEVVAEDATLAEAYKLLLESDTASRFDADDPSRWIKFCAGHPHDLSFEGLLG
jgi:Icc protein